MKKWYLQFDNVYYISKDYNLIINKFEELLKYNCIDRDDAEHQLLFVKNWNRKGVITGTLRNSISKKFTDYYLSNRIYSIDLDRDTLLDDFDDLKKEEK